MISSDLSEMYFLWLVALDNFDTKKNQAKANELDKLRLFQQKLKGVVYVSAAFWDITNNRLFGERKAYRQSNIDVYTLLAPPVELNPHMNNRSNISYRFAKNEYDKDKEKSIDKHVMDTSIATPIMASVMHNIWSMAPDFTSHDVLKSLQETTLSSPEQRERFGYIVDPKKAYKYTLGYLITEAYRNVIYPGFVSGQMKFNLKQCLDAEKKHCGLGWVMKDEKVTTNTESDEKRTKINVDVELDNIFVSTKGGGITRVKKHSVARASKSSKGRTISFNIDEVDYDEEHITVYITKKYVGTNGYSDITNKAIVFTFDNGIPKLVSEHPYQTQLIANN